MREHLIHDWNRPAEGDVEDRPPVVLLDDETLRDGLQSPAVIDPPVEVRKRILHLMDALGIDTEAAKRSDRLLEDEEIQSILDRLQHG